MPSPLASTDETASRADVPPAVFVSSSINGDPDATCVHVTGELDIASTTQLELTLREALSQAQLVVLDLRELAFIDSSGVHVIVDASIRARQVSRRLVLLGGRPNIDRMFTLSASGRALEIGRADPPRSPARGRRRRRSGFIRPVAALGGAARSQLERAVRRAA